MTTSPINRPILPLHIAVFTLDENRFAVDAFQVERVIRIIAITPLPKAPKIVLGVINVQGDIIPVVNIRARFLLPEREAVLSDNIIIVQANNRKIGIIVDSVNGVIEYSESEVVSPGQIVEGIEYVNGILKLHDGLILIHDINKFLSIEEENSLSNAMREVDK